MDFKIYMRFSKVDARVHSLGSYLMFENSKVFVLSQTMKAMTAISPNPIDFAKKLAPSKSSASPTLNN